MSEYQEHDGTGAIFPNRFKEKSSQPDMTGSITINGAQHKLAGWWNESQTSGEKYLRIRVGGFKREPQEKKLEQPATTPAPAAQPDFVDDTLGDVPF